MSSHKPQVSLSLKTRSQEYRSRAQPRQHRRSGAGSAAQAEDRGGQRLSFEVLYQSSRDDVYAYVAGLLDDREAAEDVTAASFERALRRWASYDPARGSRRAWLFGIARHAAIDELRRRSRHSQLETREVAAGDVAGDDGSSTGFRRAVVREALERLRPRERELVALKFWTGLSNVEIAQVLETSETSVGTMLHRTIGKLRRALDAPP